MKFENTQVYNFHQALLGMRNPLESWDKVDSHEHYSCNFCEHEKANDDESCYEHFCQDGVCFKIGNDDLRLAQKLIAGGSEHRKFMRQILVSVDITAPLFWWKEFDTYKVGTTANSTSTMHKLASKPITLDCFEVSDYNGDLQLIDPCPLCIRVDSFLEDLEQLRQLHLQYVEASKRESITDSEKKHFQSVAKHYWKELVRWLPESWLQTRTVTLNYEVIRNMYFQRRNHKLIEWCQDFVEWVEDLPYAKELIMYEKKKIDAWGVVKRLCGTMKALGIAAREKYFACSTFDEVLDKYNPEQVESILNCIQEDCECIAEPVVVGTVLKNLVTDMKVVVSRVMNDGNLIITYSDGSGGIINEYEFGDFEPTGETIDIRNVLDKLKAEDE